MRLRRPRSTAWALDLPEQAVKVVGQIPRGLPPLTLPTLDVAMWQQLGTAAVLISLVGFVESISVAQTLAAKRRQRIVPDQELIGLGAANIAASLTGGYPVTGGFARSVVNFEAGAETPAAGIFTAIGILIATLVLTPLIYYLPQATLAGTIIVAVLSLVDIGALKRTWDYSRVDFAAMAATIAVVLLSGVERGIATGIVLSLALHLWRTSKPHFAIVGQVPGTEHFRNVKRHKVSTSDKVVTVRVDESLYFPNARFLEDTLVAIAAEHQKSRAHRSNVFCSEPHRRQRPREVWSTSIVTSAMPASLFICPKSKAQCWTDYETRSFLGAYRTDFSVAISSNTGFGA